MAVLFRSRLLPTLIAAAAFLILSDAVAQAQEGGGRIYVANSAADTVTVIDAAQDHQIVQTLTGFSRPWGVAASPDGAFVYVTNNGSNSVTVVDAASGEIHIPAIGVGPEPRGIAVAPDGRVYVANFGGTTVSVIDPERGYAVNQISVSGGPEGMAAGSDGAVYVTNSLDISVTLIRQSGLLPRIVRRIPLGSLQPRGIAVSPDGKTLFVAASDLGMSLHILNAADGLPLRQILIGADGTGGESPPSVAVSPDGAEVYIADTSGGAVSIVNVEMGREVARVPVGGPFGVAVSPDGRWIYASSQFDSSLTLIDATTREVVTAVPVGEGPVGVAVAP